MLEQNYYSLHVFEISMFKSSLDGWLNQLFNLVSLLVILSKLFHGCVKTGVFVWIDLFIRVGWVGPG